MASVIGVARRNKACPFPILRYRYRYSLFDGPEINRSWLLHSPNSSSEAAEPPTAAALSERGIGIFTESLSDLSNYSSLNKIVLHGCLQSWKYFAEYQDEIRLLFTYNEAVYRRGISQIVAAFRKTKWLSSLQSVPVKVGIRVRRGDFLTQGNIELGLGPLPVEFFRRTIGYLEAKLSATVFFAISDDYVYCREVFRGGRFFVVPGRSPEEDMALLHLMDYVIISVGSFGWWGAFLSPAKEVIHYDQWPRPNSTLSLALLRDDYFLPHWTGMS